VRLVVLPLRDIAVADRHRKSGSSKRSRQLAEDISDQDDIDAVRLPEIVEQIEAINTDIRHRLEDRRMAFMEAGAAGFDTAVLKELVRRRRKPQGELDLFETKLAQYQRTLRDE
jgi:uncharacterized protein (UPF0335 family)